MRRIVMLTLLLSITAGGVAFANDRVGVWMRFERQFTSDKTYNHFISVAQTDERETIVAYIPVPSTVRLFNRFGDKYRGQWFHPVSNDFITTAPSYHDGLMELTSPQNSDMVLALFRARP